ncbi:hypothetical protein Tco_0214737 [Tanacetum coccineum]
MIKTIDQQLFERRLMRNLEKFVEGREYGNDFSQNQRDLPWDIPLDSLEVLSYEVSVSTEGVEELKRKVKIKGEKKEALLTLRQKPGGNPVNEILLKLNLPDHRSILTDSKIHLKMGMEVPGSI